MKFFSFKEEKNKVGRPKLADLDLKKKSIIMCLVSLSLVITLLVTGAFKLNIVSFNKMKGNANINLCAAENINPEVLYDPETNPNGFSPEFLSVVMSASDISGLNDSSKCLTVTMDELRQVTRIETGNSEDDKGLLTNAIGLQNLTNLQYLDLSNNQLTNTVDVSALTNLINLNLSNNQLTGIGNVTNLVNLTQLYLSRNKLRNIGDVSNLTNLTSLYLSENELSNIGKVTTLTNLTHLYLDDNQLSDIGYVSDLTNLVHLNLSNNQLTDIGKVTNLTNLIRLYLSNNKLSDIGYVSNLTNLSSLYLSENELDDIGKVTNLTNLTHLYLSNNYLSDIGDVSDLTNLVHLNLANNQLDDIGKVTKLTNLTRLYLSNNRLSDIGDVSNLTNLSSLYLSENELRDIGKVTNLTNLTHLYLSNNYLSDIGDVSNLTNLIHLFLENNQLTNINLGEMSSLNYFSIENNPALQTKDITLNNKVINLNDIDENITTDFSNDITCSNISDTFVATYENGVLKRNSYGLTSLTITYKVSDKFSVDVDYNITFEPAIRSSYYDIEEGVVYTKGKSFDKSKLIYDSEKYTLEKEDNILKVLDKENNEIDSFEIISYNLSSDKEGYNIDLENKIINITTELYEDVEINQFTISPSKYFTLNKNDDNETLEILSKDDNDVIDSFEIVAVDLEKITKESGFVDVNLFRKVLKTYRSNNIGTPARALTDQELTTIGSLECSNCNISDLKGLEKLTGLTYLDLSNNAFESIDLSKNTSLSSLDVLDNPNLKSINISNTQIGFFDYYGKFSEKNKKYESALEEFKAENMNSLTFLSVSGHPNLANMSVTNNKNLRTFYAYSNKLSGIIDLSTLPELADLDLSDNEIEGINVNPNPDEEYKSHIFSIYLEFNKIKGTLDLREFPDLRYLCVGNNDIDKIKFYKTEDKNYISTLENLYINNNKFKGELDLSDFPYLRELYIQNNNIDEIKFFKKEEGWELPQVEGYYYDDVDESPLRDFMAYNNNLKSLDLSNHPNIQMLMINNNPLDNIYLLKGDKKDYKKNITLSENLSFEYETIDSTIASIKNDVIKGLKAGKTRLGFFSENIYGYELEYISKCWFNWDTEYCSDKEDDDFLLPYFSYLNIYVYDVESSEYKIDNDKKIIDLQYKDFNLNKVKLHLNDLVGTVEGSKYVIKHGDVVVDEYILKNTKNDLKITPEKKKTVSNMKLKPDNKKVEVEDIKITGTRISGVQLKMIEGKDKNIILTNDDFTLTINGLDVKDINGSIDLSYELTPVKSSVLKDELLKYVEDGYVLRFKKDNNLPGKALIELNLGSKYKTLNAYLYKNGKFTLTAENIKVKNNKAKFYVTKLSTYVLTDKLKDNKDVVYDDDLIKINKKLNITNKLFIIIPILLILLVIGYIVYKKRK